MPGMNGRDLAVQLTETQPQIKVIFMSGYTDHVMTQNGVLDNSVSFLQKPFSAEKLIELVHEVLELDSGS